MSSLTQRLLREAALGLVFFLPRARRRAIERRIRGRHEFANLQRADCVIVSFAKSGRTWLRAMLSKFFQIRHGLKRGGLLAFDNFHRKNPAVPRILFTHDNYLKDFTHHRDTKQDFADRKVVLLVRHPCDIAVSLFFHWKNRMKRSKKALNRYPLEDLSLYEFVMRPETGMPAAIAFMNGWARSLPLLSDVLVVRYEDMRADTAGVLERIVSFMGCDHTEEQIQEAVSFASYENLKQLEEKMAFRWSGSRLTPGDRGNPDSYKVRRAKVGGYRDYFDDEQLARMEAMVRSELSPVFGYGEDEQAARAATAG